MRAVKSVSIDSERRVIITFLDGSTETLYPNSIWCDAEALKEIIKELLEEKADAIVQTINNVAVASFEDGADEALIRKLLVSIDPIQEGTGDPSPENVRPISGRTELSVVQSGKNLVSATQQNLVRHNENPTIIYGEDNTVTIKVNRVAAFDACFYVMTITEPMIGLPFIVSAKEYKNGYPRITKFPGGNYSVSPTDVTDSQNYVHTITQDDVGCDFAIRVYNDSGADLTFEQLQLEIGSTATEYEPYKGSTYSVNWESEAGTVCAGTVDVISGKLIVNKKLCKISDLTFTYNSQYGRFETTSLSSIIKLPPNNTTRLEGLASSIYTVRLPLNTGTNPINNTIACLSRGSIYIRDERYDDVSDFISGVGERTIMYPLAETIEYQLTPCEITTLLGTNNIWADSGDILELEYVADTKLYIGESQSGTLGSGRQTISNTDLKPVSEKTWEGMPEAYKAETEEKQTQEETEDERGE